MATQVRLFISAGPEEEPAREVLGRALAELPIAVGWKIKRTPDVDSVAECHLFALVLGRDISAPVGLELWWALRTDKPVIAYRAAAPRTPAGQVFLQENAFLAHLDETALTPRPPLPTAGTAAAGGRGGEATGAAGGGVILAPGKDTPRGARVIEG